MTEPLGRPDWRALWRSGDLPRFCFVSLGIVFHAGCENMISTLMPAIVGDIGGVELNGWNFAIYEVGSIVAGAGAGRLSLRWPIRFNMSGAALAFALGCLATALAPTMPAALGGRLLSGFGAGALISLSFVATQRYFPSAIWPQLLAVLSVVWGIAAFGGPLYGALIGTLMSWRWAFGFFAIAAVAYAVVAQIVMRREPVRPPTDEFAPFPFASLALLAFGVMAIAWAGVEARPPRAALLTAVGFAALAAFFAVDARSGAARLFPTSPFDPRHTTGAGLLMIACLAVSTCSFGFYGPLLLAALHDFTPIVTGLIIASESISWSLLSIAVASAGRRLEAPIIVGGALMVTGGVAGFAFAVPAGSIGWILFFALLQGGGFGILWPFASRRVIEAAPTGERELAASAVTTLQRLGYAVGAALAGLIANSAGFSGGFTRHAAAAAAPLLFLAFLPLALAGCMAAAKLSLRTNHPQV